MSQDLFADLRKSITLKSKIVSPKDVAVTYLDRQAWPFHDEFYRALSLTQYRKILIIAPRGHGKSEIFSHVLPIWAYLNNHNVRILIVSKAKEMATRSLGIIKQAFESNQKIISDFGDLRSKPWQDDKIYLKRDENVPLKDPSVEAVGIGGSITGAHFDLIICDDLIDNEHMKSEKKRRSVEHWFQTTLEPLLEPTGRIVVIGTRKHFKDIYQSLLDNPIWYHMACRYPEDEDHRRCGYRAILEEPASEPLVDDNGVVTDFAIKGPYRILLPERWTIQGLLKEKLSMGSPAFNSEYQNDPTGFEGLLLDEDWLQYYTDYQTIESTSMKMVIMAFDLAITEKSIEAGDYFAGIVIGLSLSNNFYVIDTLRAHLDFPSQVRKVIDWYNIHKPQAVVIETNAYQKALAQQLKEVTTIPIIEKRTDTDKYRRILEISPYFEARHVFVRKEFQDLIDEYKEFPQIGRAHV